MKRAKIGLLVAITCFCFCGFSRAAESRKLPIYGRVVDYMARPVEGAEVVCYKSLTELNRSSYEPLGQTYTTSDGRFSLEVERDVFSPVYLFAGKADLALGWGQVYRGSESVIRLGRPKLLKGTVVDETGRPVPGARVRICLKNEMMTEQAVAPIVPQDWFTTRTDSKGQFLFDNMPAGTTADFGVEAASMASVWTICDFGPGEGEQYVAGRTDIRIVLPPEASIQGRVIQQQTNEPVDGIRILAVPYCRIGSRFCREPVETDPNGQFEIAALAPGKYLLRLISDGPGSGHLIVNVEAGRLLRDIKISLEKGIPFEVAVYDMENAEPVEDAEVTVTQNDAESGRPAFERRATTGANGLARLYVPPGDCEITIIKPGFGAIFIPQTLHLDPGQPLRHEVSLPRNAIILSGEVSDEQGRVILDASVMQTTFGPRTFTDADGHFDTSDTHYFSSRIPSTARVLVRHIQSGLGAVGVLQGPTKSGRLYGRIILKPAYAITGRVTDPAGRSIPAACVKLVQRRYQHLLTEVTTNANGVYCIRSVPPPGDNLKDGYAITAYAEDFGLTQVSEIPFHNDTHKPVNLEPIVLLPKNEVISGTVEDSNEKPVAGAMVAVYGPRLSSTVGRRPYFRTLTDAQGRFRIENVCKEPLRIYTRSPLPLQQSGEVRAQGGSENVRVVLGENRIHTISLIGKPLPAFEDMSIDFDSEQTQEKMVLVCFWDMNQRPSRYCLQQLSERAQELKAQDIAVVTVQASKVDKGTFDEWIKKYNVPFSVGMVRGNEEKVRFAWGVKSLPWLILTDRERIVHAEGFGFNELDGQIEQISKSKKN